MIFFMILASYAAEVLVSILLSEDEIRTFHEYDTNYPEITSRGLRSS